MEWAQPAILKTAGPTVFGLDWQGAPRQRGVVIMEIRQQNGTRFDAVLVYHISDGELLVRSANRPR
jgi:hypothetical protein